MTIRLRPRSDSWQKLHQFEMNFEPPPSGISDLTDLDGTSTSHLWFTREFSSFKISTTACVETLRENPFDFILGDPEFFELPVKLSDYDMISLGPYLLRTDPSKKVDDFTKEIAEEENRNTLLFLSTLCARVSEKFHRTLRVSGDPLTPEELLTTNEGACRDLTVFFMDACRSQGIPARFTSGYFYGDESNFDRQLHAWAEIYLPGGGWRGYDPSVGLPVANQHVAIASGSLPSHTAPTSGSYRGNTVDSNLDFKIEIQVAESFEELLNSPPAKAVKK